MRKLVLVPAVLWLAVAATLAARFPDPAVEREYELATRTILCDCGCSPQSVHDCSCGHAAEVRDDIAGLIQSGRTGQQVIETYVARHGEKIRIAPVASGFNLFAWLGPGLAMLGGVLAVTLVLLRWKGKGADRRAADAPRPDAASTDDPYVARVEQQLREYE